MNKHFNYRYVNNIDHELISLTVLPYLPANFRDNSGFWGCGVEPWKQNPYLSSAIETIKPWNEVMEIIVISLQPGSDMVIHTDTGMYEWLEKGASRYALNIPIQNCDNTITTFYKLKEGYEPNRTNLDFVRASINYADTYPPHTVEVLEQFVLNKPALFNVLVPHNAVNLSDTARILLSVRFLTKFDWE